MLHRESTQYFCGSGEADKQNFVTEEIRSENPGNAAYTEKIQGTIFKFF